MSVPLIMEQARRQQALSQSPVHVWPGRDEEPWAMFYTGRSRTLVRFPSLADFDIADDGSVTCHPVPEVPATAVEHLFRNQVVPLALSRAGQLVFHASAVAVSGRCLAFIGPSGRGKSTLAASFATSGHHFMVDDGLLLEGSGTEWRAVASHPALRLWSDSHAALIPNASGPGGTGKAQLVAGDQLPHCDKALPLDKVFLLGDGSAAALEIARVKPQEALMALLSNSFLLDVHDDAALAGHFDRLAALSHLPIFYRLDFPRRYEMLEQVKTELARGTGRSSPP